ncbi:olfactory receptor 39 isoform X1 [Bombyx mori]
MLSNVGFFLRPLTIIIDNRRKERIPLYWYAATGLSIACYSYIYQISMLWSVFSYFTRADDVLAGIVIFSLGVSSEIGLVKLCFMYANIDKIQKITEGYLKSDAASARNSRFSKNILHTMQSVKKRGVIFWLVIISNGVVYLVKPIVTPGRHFMEDQFIILGLEPKYETPNYEIGFFMMAVGVCVTCYLPANITAYLITVAGYSEAQFLALGHELANLWPDAQLHCRAMNLSQSVNEQANEYVKMRLRELVKIHSTNVNLLRDIEGAFRGAIAVEFLLLIVGLIAELLGGLENTYMQVPFALIQVSVDCLTGQRVMDANLALERAVYDCRWEEFDASNRRVVLLLLQNAQKVATLSAGGIATLNFSCLMAVIKSIYSAYTTLRTTMK